MNHQVTRQPGDIRFVELMRAGQVAYAKGKRQQAHHIWRRAAMLRPYEEQVWLALLNVVETDEDRRVCLENVTAINPHNLHAQYQLTSTFPNHPQRTTGEVIAIPVEQPRLWRYVLLRFVEALALGVLLGTAVSLLIYR